MCSSGTVCGISPLKAGRKNASEKPNTTPIATMCQTRTTPAKISTARVPCSTMRTRSEAIITVCRGSRSAMTPPISTNTVIGSA